MYSFFHEPFPFPAHERDHIYLEIIIFDVFSYSVHNSGIQSWILFISDETRISTWIWLWSLVIITGDMFVTFVDSYAYVQALAFKLSLEIYIRVSQK